MSKKERRPILFNGQVYVEPIIKKSGFGGKSMKQQFEQARLNIINDLSATKRIIRGIPNESKLPNEIVLSLIVEPEYTAKSYYPETIFDLGYEKFGLQEIGSRTWKNINPDEIEKKEGKSKEKMSKLYFIRTTINGLDKFENFLNKPASSFNDSFTKDIRKISKISLMDSGKILGLNDEWQSGRIEAVLHPFAIDKDQSLKHFLKLLESKGINENLINYKQYESGVSFVSFHADRNIVNSLSTYNPLRTAHPLDLISIPKVERGATITGAPSPPKFLSKSKIIVGVIDGGYDSSNIFTKDYTEHEQSVIGNTVPELVNHGTQVTGALLFGPLNHYSPKETLPEPKVSVKNFGVLSDQTTDPDLYKAIDAIENFVPLNKEICVYNLSLGPRGPILDDSINRFTYSCDLLSSKHDKLFCVAVGNDGHITDYDRIQSPSDSVNCLAVGASTTDGGKIIRAPYSCKGPGREGCKLKPDVVAFGGCRNHPIHLVSSKLNEVVSSAGTSFSSPIVASVAGRLIGESNESINSLIAKGMIIHSARISNSNKFDNEMGHGHVPVNYDEIITCGEKSYTLIYKGEIEPGKYAEYQIPWKNSIEKGKVNLKWTVAVQSDVDHLSSDDYTSSSVEVTFYPNKNKFQFNNVNNSTIDGELKKSEVVDISLNPERANHLHQNGWKRATFPKTDSAKGQFQSELDLRDDLKWDSLDSRELSKLAKNVTDPVFHVHALGRGKRNSTRKVKFVLILTVEAPKADVDLYSEILNKYAALVPLSIKTQADINVQV